MKFVRNSLVVLLIGAGVYWLAHNQSPIEATQVQSPTETLTKAPQQDITEGLASTIRIKGRKLEVFTLEERMVHHKVPGVSIALLEDHEVAWTLTLGMRDVESGLPVDAKTVFQAGSISKPVFATALMAYRQDEGLDLDADINTLLKRWQLPEHEWQESQPVTLRRLLSHSAGTTVHGFRGYADGEDRPDLVAVLEGNEPSNSGPIRVDIEPGSRFRYSGGGTTLAQMAFEDQSTLSLTDAADQYVFAPLGMTRSTYSQPLWSDLVENSATPYRGTGDPVEGGAHTYIAGAAAGLWTTPSDLMRLAGAMQHAYQGKANDWLEQSTAREMLTIQHEPVGIGFFLSSPEETPAFSHGGANAGFMANFYAHSEAGTGIAIMTNSDNGGVLIREIMIRVSEVYGWDAASPVVKTLVALTHAELDEYVGIYAFDDEEDLKAIITRDGDELVANVAQFVVDQHFMPEGSDVFFSLEGAVVQFDRDENGKVNAFNIFGSRATRVE